MKKTAAILLALAMVFSMASCENKDSSASGTSSQGASVSSSDSASGAENVKKYKISFGDYSAAVQAIGELTEWKTSSYKRSKENAVCAYGYNPLYYCAFNVYPEYKAAELMEIHKDRGYKLGTLEYNGKTVKYSINYLIDGTNLIDSMTLHLPIGDGYVRELGISSGGTLYHSVDHPENEEIEDWVKKNKEKYKDLSDDPQDYVYLFKAFI